MSVAATAERSGRCVATPPMIGAVSTDMRPLYAYRTQTLLRIKPP
jgi:hypothetical protein